MNWEDECYLLSKSKFRENSNIINDFSNENNVFNKIQNLNFILASKIYNFIHEDISKINETYSYQKIFWPYHRY